MSAFNIEIDKNAGFCFGVERAIQQAEEYLKNNESLYCLGDMVHNEAEVERLKQLGLITISKDFFEKLKDATVLLRAHGEPPEIYAIAKKNNIRIIDATCPLVIRLQKKVKEISKTNDDVIIYGKRTHPEVIGLAGQIPHRTTVIEDESDIENVEITSTVQLYSQTTKSLDNYLKIKESLEQKVEAGTGYKIIFNDSICRQVHGRNNNLKEFCKKYDVIIFVGGKKSSNAKVLFDICRKANKDSYFVSSTGEIRKEWLKGKKSIGISGATSTPSWLLEKVKVYLAANWVNMD